MSERSTLLSRPAAGMLLGDQCVDVVTVEAPTSGDAAPTLCNVLYVHADYRNKQSIALGTKSTASRELIDGLVGKADVLYLQNVIACAARHRAVHVPGPSCQPQVRGFPGHKAAPAGLSEE